MNNHFFLIQFPVGFEVMYFRFILKTFFMKKQLFLFLSLMGIIPAFTQISFDQVNVEAWFGNGINEVMMIIDFDADPVGSDSSFAWGIRFSENSISGESILSLIEQNDENFSYSMNGSFLYNISYLSDGLTYTNPNAGWFSILESTNGTTWDWNDGITDVVSNGEWFGVVVMNEDTWEAEINVPLLTRVQYSLSDEIIKVYPNPVSHTMYFDGKSITGIIITDIYGRQVYKTSTSVPCINMSDFLPGYYLVTVTIEDNIFTKKILLTR